MKKIKIKKSTIKKLKNTGTKVKGGFVAGFKAVIRAAYLGIRKAFRAFAALPFKTQMIALGSVAAALVVILIVSIASGQKRSASLKGNGGLMLAESDYKSNFSDTETSGEYTLDPDDDYFESEEIYGAAPDSEEESDAYDAEPSAQSSESDSSGSFSTLKEGSDGEVVSKIQSTLMDLGYMDPDEPTEHYGPNTKTAVAKFQSHNNLNADGICTEETYSLLMSKDAKQYVMQLGDEGEDVENVQHRLYELGFIEKKSNITGTFGEKTEAAAKEFQKKNKLSSDGKMGSVSLETLFDEKARGKCYEIGDKNDTIKSIQKKLSKLGYYNGKEDGEYNKATQTAVKKFQRCNGLTADGELGPVTRDTILSKDANSYVIQLGDSGTDVKKIQQRLVKLKYLRSGNANGYFGQKTAEAVMAFQDRNKLHSDGKIGRATYDTLFSNSAKRAKTVTTSSGKSGSGGSSSGGGSSIGVFTNTSGVERLLDIANSKLGCKYVSGSKGPNTFDCSGFVYYCLKNAGVSVSYMTSIGWRSCSRFTRISSLSSCQRGDILVFSGSTSSTGHVGIYMGSGKMIDAGSSSGCVRTTSTVLKSGSYWMTHFICAYRVF